MQVRPLRKATQLSNRNAFIILTMMLFILWIATTRAPFLQNRELSEGLELLVIDNWGMISTVESFFVILLALIQQIGIILLVLCIAAVGGGILAPP